MLAKIRKDSRSLRGCFLEFFFHLSFCETERRKLQYIYYMAFPRKNKRNTAAFPPDFRLRRRERRHIIFLRNCEFCRFALAILCGCSYNMLHAKQLNDKQFAIQQ